ncbi:pentapeptide repeat-containing protein [Iodobacter sp. CM08]|uniref:pentapeptide repeat-containing protein n=1 Tax=Iodobacter sp. CM08 TaxID=3085902 RepID=UPI0029829514|nr:pentapeptide repeat-containing protein [Iodobacter sp. CM08]MDW5419260.1 pentapeptide repeat-containing protein [Iodobacter sp. CM08]
MIKNSNREKLSDKMFDSPVCGGKFVNKLFERLVAKKVEFKNVDFRYCIFDSSYLRNCSFEDCDFTGSRFVNSNLVGSSFNGCKFDYASFEKSHIDSDILKVGCPGPENLKLKFARSLRINYQQLGDAKSANQAISIELQASEDHLHKAWKSQESYYRKKFKGLNRIKVFFEWFEFKVLDFIWGNGESTWKLFRAVFIALLLISGFHAFINKRLNDLNFYCESFILSPQILLGVLNPAGYPSLYLTVIFLFRLIMFGFFMSIIIKRFNRR